MQQALRRTHVGSSIIPQLQRHPGVWKPSQACGQARLGSGNTLHSLSTQLPASLAAQHQRIQARVPRPSAVAAAVKPGGPVNAAAQAARGLVDVVKREQGLQSNKLPTALRERVEAAVEVLRFRVTVGDVAAKAGVKLTEADDALKALAYDAQATLEVSEQGDVVYDFPRNFRSAIQARSVWLQAQPVLKGAQRAGAYLVRVAFGTALLSSVALVWFVIAVLLSSRDSDRRDRGGSGYYNSFGSYNGGGLGARVWFDVTDLFWYLDPRFSSASRRRVEEGAQMTFLEAIFSFVFGDGDPNQRFDDVRWAALGRMIQERGGVVTAEEMAPYLDPPVARGSSGKYEDESFVLPALIRFGGEPSVDDTTGGIIYTFPSLQASAVTSEWVRGGAGPAPDLVQEESWELTAASSGQVLGVVALGVFNLVGVLTLAGLLADPGAQYALAYQGLGWVAGLLPALQLYAISFFGIPLVRQLFNLRRNAEIEERNTSRSKAARLLHSGARWVEQKLAAARQLGRSRHVRRGDAVFTTDKAVDDQVNERELSDWDRKLRSSPASSLPRPRESAVQGWDQRVPRQQPRGREWEEVRQPGSGQGAAGGARGRRRDFDGGWE